MVQRVVWSSSWHVAFRLERHVTAKVQDIVNRRLRRYSKLCPGSSERFALSVCLVGTE